MSLRPMIAIALVLIGSMARPVAAPAQDDRLREIEQRLDALEQRGSAGSASRDRFEVLAMAALPVLGIGLFCGLWARSTGRDFWLWFVGGMVFNLLALLVLYSAIDDDKKAKRKAAEKAAKEPLDL